MSDLFKGSAGNPSLTHQPGTLMLHRGGKQVTRRRQGRISLFQKDSLSTSSVHAGGTIQVKPARKKSLFAKSDDGAMTVIAEINARIAKFNSNHDEKGRFSSSDSASASMGATSSRALGEAIGSVGGTYAGQYLGGIAGSAVGPAGTVVGAKLGGFVGGMAGDYAGRKIAQALYSAYSGTKTPEGTIGSELGGAAGGVAGYLAAGPAGAAAGTALKLSVNAAEATARVLGTAAGDISGTRFGSYVQSRVGGVLSDTKGHLATRYALDAGADAITDAVTKPLSMAKRGMIGLSPPAVTGTAPRVFPMTIRDDLNIRGRVDDLPRTRFNQMMNDRETKARIADTRAALRGIGRRPENYRAPSLFGGTK